MTILLKWTIFAVKDSNALIQKNVTCFIQIGRSNTALRMQEMVAIKITANLNYDITYIKI